MQSQFPDKKLFLAALAAQRLTFDALKKNINILNHIAYKSINFEKDCKMLIKQGLSPLTKAMGAVAFKNKKVIFFYTKENFVLEIIEK